LFFNLPVFAANTDQNIDTAKKKEIGKVLKVKRGKGLVNEERLKKNQKIYTGEIYKVLVGGYLHLMLDDKTRIYLGHKGEIIINKFDRDSSLNNSEEEKIHEVEHEVEIELLSGSFSYKSLNKTSTILKVIAGNELIISKGLNTNVAFREAVGKTGFVNAGDSSLSIGKKIFIKGESGILDLNSKNLTMNLLDTDDNGEKIISNISANALILESLGDLTMTEQGSNIMKANMPPEQAEASGASAGGGGC
jgi:hypothetical protein